MSAPLFIIKPAPRTRPHAARGSVVPYRGAGTVLSVWIPAQQRAELLWRADRAGIGLSCAVREAIRRYLEGEE